MLVSYETETAVTDRGSFQRKKQRYKHPGRIKNFEKTRMLVMDWTAPNNASGLYLQLCQFC